MDKSLNGAINGYANVTGQGIGILGAFSKFIAGELTSWKNSITLQPGFQTYQQEHGIGSHPDSKATKGDGTTHDTGGNAPGAKGSGGHNDGGSKRNNPIILDLNGDGIAITPKTSSNIFFDTENDGYKHRTAWAGEGDAVLAYDANGDGKIDQRNEIVFTDWDPTAKSDMQALRDVFDTNHNGKLDSGDDKFSSFKVVVTKADGTTEIKSLSDATIGITSINLIEDETSIALPDGSVITGQTTFDRTVGGVTTTGIAATVSLLADSNGYAIDRTETTEADGSYTIDNKARNADGSLANETISNTKIDAAGGVTTKTVTTKFDWDGDLVVDQVQIDETVTQADKSKVETLTNRDGGNILIDQTITTTSADGKTIHIYRNLTGGDYNDQVEDRVTDGSGNLTITTSNFNADSSLTDKTEKTRTADGLSLTTKEDLDGDGDYDLITTDVTVVNGDGSRTDTVTEKSNDGTTLDKTTTVTSANGQSKTITIDSDGNGTIDLTQSNAIVIDSLTGISTTTLTDKSSNGTLIDKTVVTMSADNLSKTTQSDLDGDGDFDLATTDVTTVDGPGNRTQTIIDWSNNASVLNKTVIVKGADGRSRTIQTDLTGDGIYDQTETIVIGGGGSSTDTTSEFNTDGSLISKTIISTSADGLTTLREVDQDGNGTTDLTTSDVFVLNGDKSSTETVINSNNDKSLRSESVTTISADGLSITTQSDITGDGFVDMTHSDVTVLNGDKSQTITVTDKNGDNSLHAQTVTTISADRRSISVSIDADGDGKLDRIETIVTGKDGAVVDTVSDLNTTGALIDKIVTTTSGNKLSQTVETDLNGDSVVDLKTTGLTVLNNVGGKTDTVSHYAGTSLRDKSVVTTSGNGLSLTTNIDQDGDGDTDLNITDVTVLNADGSRTETITNTAGSTTRDQTVTTISGNGLSMSTTMDQDGDGDVDRTTTDVTVLNADGSRTETVTVSNGGGVQSQSVTTTSADARTVTISRVVNSSANSKQSETIVTENDGDIVDTTTNSAADNTLLSKATTTTSANGLSTTTEIDADGDGDIDAKITDVTVLNANGSTTETVIYTGTRVGKNIVDTSANGLSVVTQSDVTGDGVTDLTQNSVTVLNADGSKIATITETNANASLHSKSTTTISADRRTISISMDANGDGKVDHIETTVTQANGDVIGTQYNLNADGTVINEAITTTNANKLSQTTELDLDGDSVIDLKTTDVTVLNADGSRTETITDQNGNGSVRDKTVVVLDAVGLSKTTQIDRNGDGIFDLTTTDVTVLGADGKHTETITDKNTDGTTRDQTVVTVSATGLSTTTTRDFNGDGTADLTTTDVSVLNANGSRTETVQNTNANGLRDQSVTTTSADGRTTTESFQTYGSVNTNQTEIVVIQANGDVVDTLSNLTTGGALLNKVVQTTSANGLSKTTQTDQNGDGTIDFSKTDTVVLNTDGSRTQTITTTNAGGTVATTSANGLSKTTLTDQDGDGDADLTETDVLVLNADGSRTETVTDANSDSSTREIKVTQTSSDGKTVTVSTTRGGTVIKNETIVIQANGDRVDTVANFTMSGAALSSLVTTTSADGLSKIVQAKNAAGAVFDTQAKQMVLNLDGSRTETFNQTGSVNDEIVKTTSADGLTITTATSLVGLKSLSVKTLDLTTLNSDGSRTQTITNTNPDTSLKDKVIIVTSDDGLSQTAQADINGDGKVDITTSSVTAVDGSKTETEVMQSSITGLLLRKDVTSTSADGRTSIWQCDSDGNGIFDQTDTTVMNADGSVTVTRTGFGVPGGQPYNQVTTTTTALDGGTIETMQHYDSRGALLDKAVATTSANGLAKNTTFDTNGDGAVDEMETDTIVLNADGSQTETDIFAYSVGIPKSKTVTTTSADGSSATVTLDNDGNGISERTFLLTIAADGSRSTTVTDFNNTTGAQTQQTVYTTSANGLVSAGQNAITSTRFIISEDSPFANRIRPASGGNATEIEVHRAITTDLAMHVNNSDEGIPAGPNTNGFLNRPSNMPPKIKRSLTIQTTTSTTTFLDTKTEFAEANGSYQWVRTNTSQLAGSSAHLIDENQVDTWSWNIASTTLWNQTTSDVIVAASGSIQIDIETENKYVDTAMSMYVTLLDRGMTGDERETLAQYIQNGTLNKKLLATNLIASAEFTAKYGTLTTPSFVDVIFKNAFGDWPSALVQSDYVSKVTAGNMTLADVLIAVAANAADLQVIKSDSRDGVVSNTISYTNAVAKVTANLATPASNAGEAAGDTYFGIANLIGSHFSDSLTGDGADNFLVGGAGADVLTGGAGNDTASYATAQTGVIANLTTPAGNTGDAAGDTYSAIENLIGSAFNDTLTGTTAANVIVGGAGADALDGGAANDTASYVGSSAGVTVDLTAGTATGGDAAGDTLVNFENLTGSSFNDVLTGTSGINVLNGGAGNDTLVGGAGNDTYVVDSAGDVVVEAAGAGTDLVQSTASNYTLSSDAENLTLLGTGNINGTGNSTNNIITGNAGNNVLDGGASNDWMIGGLGNDTYYVDQQTDVTEERDTVGVDTVIASTSYILGNTIANYVENLVLLAGKGSIDGEGNWLDNTITGNEGNNKLTGDNGNDTLIGGLGDDTLDGYAGVDTASYLGASGSITASLTSNTASGAAGNDTLKNVDNLIGGAFNDTLTGDANANTLDGGAGNDTLAGAAGNDIYVVDSLNDTVTEAAAAGADAVQTAVDGYALTANVENLTMMGAGNISGAGNDLANVITGNDGANTLDGGVEASAIVDTLKGGKGDDTYVIRTATDVVTEVVGEGTDTIDLRVTGYTMAANVEKLVIAAGLTGITATGSAGDDRMFGNEVANTLIGGSGNDILVGGDGGDNLTGGVGTLDLASYENATKGVVADFANTANNTNDAKGDSYTTIEGLIGSAFDDTLRGTTTNDRLDGGKGNDTLEGGTGNDTYVVDSLNDTVTEAAAAGTDAVESWVDGYALTTNVENLTLMGAGNISGAGNDLANVITGNDGANTLDGGVEASAIVDTLKGGKGDDTYIIRTATDVVTEVAGEGADTIDLRVTGYTMAANVEKLVIAAGLTGITATGSAGDDRMFGNEVANTLIGGSGNDILVGGDGGDNLTGGVGTLDLASYENATKGVVADFANTANNTNDAKGDSYTTIEGLIGSAFDDTLRGTTTNDRLDGGKGNDILEGGTGNDTYVVDSLNDTVTEAAAAGTDAVESWVDGYALTTNVENLTLMGAGNISGTGNDLANTIIGNDGANTLDGGVEASAIVDTLKGGKGDDTYIIRTATDVITEVAGEGTDTIDLRVTGYTMANNVENLTIYQGLSSISATGNALNNLMTGNEVDNTLDGGAGDDTLDGGAGADAMTGGTGNDTVTYINSNKAVSVNLTTNTASGGFAQGDTFITVEHLIGSAFNDVLTGSATDNTLFGAKGNDTLYGAAGNDRLYGEDGNDVLVGGAGSDVLQGGAGNDTAYYSTSTVAVTVNLATGSASGGDAAGDSLTSIENLTGTNFADSLTGDGGSNVINGDEGADALAGGGGNDTYFIDNVGDVVTENAGDGIDTVHASLDWILAANIENLVIDQVGTWNYDGTGNALDNIITGNWGTNILDGGAGNDRLDDGGQGYDTLKGGTGDDVYIVSNSTDTVVENLGEGADLVLSGDSFTLTANVENLTLTGSFFINGTGNALDNVILGNSAGNKLTGSDGNDLLDGGGGNDTLIGGTGNDTYVVDRSGDVVTENVSEGTDLVQSSITLTLGANVENLTLTGTSAINGTGNALDNLIVGNSGANTLTGADGNDILDAGAGNDTMIGGQGADEFRFGPSGGSDTIDAYDTDSGTDKLSVGMGVAKDQLWFTQSGNDLIMSIIGTNDKVTVQSWYASTDHQLSSIQLSDGKYASASDVEALRTAMAAFSPPPLGQTTLDPSTLASLTPTLAASWH